MKKTYIILTIISMIFTSCVFKDPDVIIVYYKHGFVDTSTSIPCSKMRESALNEKKRDYIHFDTVYVTHPDFAKIKNYISNMQVVPSDDKTEIPGIDSRIVAVYDTLAVSFGENFAEYGANSNNQLVYSNNEIVYLLKSLSGYYNYFDDAELLVFFPEIKEYGIPATYKHVMYPDIDNKIVENKNPLNSRVILVDSGS